MRAARSRRTNRSGVPAEAPADVSPDPLSSAAEAHPLVRGPRAARTVERILQATREVLLLRGYAGTTVEEIARLAGVSRPSFYTYFPSKEQAFRALGMESAEAGEAMVRVIEALARPLSAAGVAELVRRAFEILGPHASFSLAWTQAAHHDDAVRREGMRRHLRNCAAIGEALGDARGRPYDDPLAQGLLFFSMIERSGTFVGLYQGAVPREVVEHAACELLTASLLAPVGADA